MSPRTERILSVRRFCDLVGGNEPSFYESHRRLMAERRGGAEALPETFLPVEVMDGPDGLPISDVL
ncbi:MAG: hypothetical protein ACKV0T_30730 [Planctomycetales bacterium]